MSKTRLWILGAADPEMTQIERLLTEAGERVAYAVGPDGQRVHPGNAYRAVGYRPVADSDFARDGEDDPLYLRDDGDCYLVECGGSLPDAARLIDHHRPGDPGYGRPPGDFLQASSIGQVYAILHALGVMVPGSRNPVANTTEVKTTFCLSPFGGWYLPISSYRDGDPSSDDSGDLGWGVHVPEEIVFAAAADHCLAAAYRGECPGVDPDALMQWRVETRAAHQGRTFEAVLADVEAARLRLREAVSNNYAMDCGHGEHLEAGCPGCGMGTPLPFADLRGESIPELPEAAAREGIPFLSTVRDKDGREKVVLQAAPADLVRRFLAGEIVPGLTDLYGDPARGFAGGYVLNVAAESSPR